MAEGATHRSVLIRPFAWDDWPALWAVRLAHLAELGVVLDPTAIPERPEPGAPDSSDEYEWDLHHIDRVYLRGAGNFWLAWRCDLPVGYVGGQEIGDGAMELRRMYVNATYRRRGIGTSLVRALIAHAQAHGVHAIELWTAPDGPGRPLYEQLGFRETAGPGIEFREVAARSRYTPGTDEIRMRLVPRTGRRNSPAREG
jgi:GNAT superfamily N-acetyltransferase